MLSDLITFNILHFYSGFPEARVLCFDNNDLFSAACLVWLQGPEGQYNILVMLYRNRKLALNCFCKAKHCRHWKSEIRGENVGYLGRSRGIGGQRNWV